MANTEHESGPGYEERDVNIGAILRPALALVVVTVLTFVGMRWLSRHYEAVEAEHGVALSPLEAKERQQPPPEPRLQVSPPKDLVRMQAEEATALEGYGWVDAKAGVVRIPIERAIEVLAGKGLPARTSPAGEGR